MDEFNLHLTGDIHAITAGWHRHQLFCLENLWQHFNVKWTICFSQQPFGGSDRCKNVPRTGSSHHQSTSICQNTDKFDLYFYLTNMADSTTGGLLWAPRPKSEGESKIQPHPGKMSCGGCQILLSHCNIHPCLILTNVRWGDLLNLASRREIPTRWLQMKSGPNQIEFSLSARNNIVSKKDLFRSLTSYIILLCLY